MTIYINHNEYERQLLENILSDESPETEISMRLLQILYEEKEKECEK